VSEIELRDLGVGDAGWLIQQQPEIYTAEEEFDHTFGALVAEILAGFIRSRDPEMERAWIAWEGDQRLDSIFCVKGLEMGVAKLRMFLLSPGARGKGLGRWLLRE
jgi:GNAT superfamily N-acetyltransferase